ncbi:unnamed protein product [Nesidiocoris tenuis]|uniref:Uncharacterized protein n=1 Tax=Nesidiocoris tenuis TaxID=355587 RepID=A0A6H5GXV4_9HEMI|nr:unnamed protein product [Nesidiocoris tenuis]
MRRSTFINVVQARRIFLLDVHSIQLNHNETSAVSAAVPRNEKAAELLRETRARLLAETADSFFAIELSRACPAALSGRVRLNPVGPIHYPKADREVETIQQLNWSSWTQGR